MLKNMIFFFDFTKDSIFNSKKTNIYRELEKKADKATTKTNFSSNLNFSAVY